jgi:hypothetical protein
MGRASKTRMGIMAADDGTKGAAKEEKLAELHVILTDILIAQVGEEREFVAEDGKVEKVYTATPALLTVAQKFLKENNITCQPAEGDKLSTLQEKLAKRKLASVTPLREAAHE